MLYTDSRLLRGSWTKQLQRYDEHMIIYVEAAGCPDACRHCFANGHRPVGAHFCLDELRAMREEWGPLVIYHEPTAHPQFPEIFDPQLILPHGGHTPTNGFGLARRSDYAAVLTRMYDLGLRNLHFTLHGLRDHHDWFVCRKGAFDDVVLAGRRARAAGFQIDWQIFLDRRNIATLPELVDLAIDESGTTPILAIPYHRVSQRLWRYETLRPRLTDIRQHPLAEDIYRRLQKQQPEAVVAEAWLEKWIGSPDTVQFRHPFEPPTWPPSPMFDALTLYILRDRSVYLDPMCAPRKPLGSLSEGKDAIMQRLQTIPNPTDREIIPEAVVLAPEEREELHPACFSVRYKAISKALLARQHLMAGSSHPVMPKDN